jgi:hypothetical protein
VAVASSSSGAETRCQHSGSIRRRRMNFFFRASTATMSPMSAVALWSKPGADFRTGLPDTIFVGLPSFDLHLLSPAVCRRSRPG